MLVPGTGHIEMNILRSCVELTFEVFYKEILKSLNFTTDKALHYAKKVNDFHKGWQVLTVLRCAVTDELIRLYVIDKLQNSGNEDKDLNVADFFRFLFTSKNENYSFAADIVFELLDSLILLRLGIHTGSIEKIDSGIAKCAKVFYGRVHPMYREVETSYSMMREKIPQSLVPILTLCLSINVKGQPYTGEGVDFRVEENNQGIQPLVGRDAEFDDWVVACANYKMLNELRGKTFSDMGINDPKESNYQHTDDYLVPLEKKVRKRIRENNYFEEVHTEKKLHSLSSDGKELSKDLHNFLGRSRELRSKYVMAYMEHEMEAALMNPCSVSFKEPPVSVTKEEEEFRAELKNLSCDQLADKAGQMILSIGDDIMADVFKDILSSLTSKKTVNKKCLLALIAELDAFMELGDSYVTRVVVQEAESEVTSGR